MMRKLIAAIVICTVTSVATPSISLSHSGHDHGTTPEETETTSSPSQPLTQTTAPQYTLPNVDRDSPFGKMLTSAIQIPENLSFTSLPLHQEDSWGSVGTDVLGEIVFVCLMASPFLLHFTRRKLTT